ncbi:hypothetical protein GCM10022261_02070 [Brevibacterium daeguense]|uniref:DUF3263 domain-containing protein n=1 Tax=Brevibacterium daeguense TaxID=909936 RepID=A0ABP8EFN1_9MICO|nr:DUF3263 domain-containing protein [Brevibacterium daeguense]
MDSEALTDFDREMLDLERSEPTSAQRREFCTGHGIAIERYPAMLDGLADTSGAMTFAPQVVARVRAARTEAFRYQRYRRARSGGGSSVDSADLRWVGLF